MWYELLNNRTVKVVEEKKKKSKQRPGSLPVLIRFLGIDSTDLIGHLLCAQTCTDDHAHLNPTRADFVF